MHRIRFSARAAKLFQPGPVALRSMRALGCRLWGRVWARPARCWRVISLIAVLTLMTAPDERVVAGWWRRGFSAPKQRQKSDDDD